MKDTKKKYKYHYVIYEKDNLYGWFIKETAQDLLYATLILDWLCEYHGITYHQNLKVCKERISKEDWERRYC